LLIRLMLLMTLLPALELTLLIKVHGFFAASYGGFFGLLVTVGTIVLTGIVGANLARAQGLGLIKRLQENMSSGKVPTDEAIDGVMILVGGAMLLTPGFITDFSGLTMLFTPTRRIYKTKILAWAKKKIASGEFQFNMATPQYQGSAAGPFTQPQRGRPSAETPNLSPHANDPDVIDVDIVKD
jgi:UPF0716 protein FxsA